MSIVVVENNTPQVIKTGGNTVSIIDRTPEIVQVGINASNLGDMFLKKTGDTGTGDFTFEQDVEVNGNLTENGARAFTVLQSVRNLYVNESTGDDSNDGRSAATPFATIQKGLNEAAFQASSDQTIVNIAPGTYAEAVVSPKYGLGEVLLLGDRSTPANVIIQGDLPAAIASTGITHYDTTFALVVEGITFQNYFYCMQAQNARLEVGGCVGDNIGYFVRQRENSSLLLFDNGVANTTITGTKHLRWAALFFRK